MFPNPTSIRKSKQLYDGGHTADMDKILDTKLTGFPVPRARGL